MIGPEISQLKCFYGKPKNWAIIHTTKVRAFDQIEATPSQKLWRADFVGVGVCPQVVKPYTAAAAEIGVPLSLYALRFDPFDVCHTLVDCFYTGA